MSISTPEGPRPVRSAAGRRLQRAVARPVDGIAECGRQLTFYGRALASVRHTIVRYRKETLRLIAEVSLGSGALAVIGGSVMVIGFLTAAAGYEVGQQGTKTLGSVGISAMAGFVSAFINTREAIPVVAGVALTATVGAGFTAQLGAMRVSEEIDALESMSVPSIPYLVTTRIMAGCVAVVPLYAIALIMGYASTRVVTVWLAGESSGTYAHYFNVFLVPTDVLWSLLKVMVMALAVMCVHCYHGFTASGGPAGVGMAVGRSVRTSLIAIMVVDLLIGIAIYGNPASSVRISG